MQAVSAWIGIGRIGCQHNVIVYTRRSSTTRTFYDLGRQRNNSKIKCFHESSVDAFPGAAHPRNSGSEFYAGCVC